jgi:hypothetical protein
MKMIETSLRAKKEVKEEPAYYSDMDKKRTAVRIFDDPLLYYKVN